MILRFEEFVNESINLSNSELEKIAKRIKSAIDDGDIKLNTPVKINGKEYRSIEEEDPKRFKKFKF